MSTTMERTMLELLEPNADTLLDLSSSPSPASAIKEDFWANAATEDNVLDMISAVMFVSAIVIMATRVIMSDSESSKLNVSLRWRLWMAMRSFQQKLKATLLGNNELDELDMLGEYNPDEDPLYRRIDVGTLLQMMPKPDKSLPKGALHTEADPHQARRPRGAPAPAPAPARRSAADLGDAFAPGNRRAEDRWNSLRSKPSTATKSSGIMGPPGLSMMGDDTETPPKTDGSGASALLATVLREEPAASASKPGSLSGSLTGGMSLRPMGGSLKPARKL
eukprot:gnl/TRDRNA2_/TRDRNA2_178515_c0_seq1.p1 gnl/TRDRNA2_/TRDRNA2_178515_c0~~gnl/TRDRNA2_/TRDRNA2_178515_c0_seq1.p1  ORF type:complete len:278 (-),score=58.40 gnl/TRDRNA2_/TRDRNA2_178515_c0_seq1:79-912(-)